MDFCFENFFNISTYTWHDHGPIKNLSKEKNVFSSQPMDW